MDGYEDYLKINYQLEKSGYSANVSIYDTKGHKIIDLVENELTGKQGHWTWDGRNQNDASSALGIYILIFELIHADGEIINEKMVCTLAGKL
jgi:flagellar hook assembly protein FlgD